MPFIVIWELLLLSGLISFVICDTNGGLLIIPGLGRRDRLSNVVNNVKLLVNEGYFSTAKPLDCVIFVYESRENNAFWRFRDDLDYLSKYCDLLENHGKRVSENLFLVQPALVALSYSYVFVLLDDCKLLDNKISSLDSLLSILYNNKLSVVSPMVIGANVGGGQKFRTIMQRPAEPGTKGYVSSFVELFAWVMTIPAYRSLWELLNPSINPYGWGYDFWYDQYSKDRLIASMKQSTRFKESFPALFSPSYHRLGIASNIQVKHDQNVYDSNQGRTETATVEVKWQALVNQEKFYDSYLGIPLKYYREHLDMANTSWNGPVKGYLY